MPLRFDGLSRRRPLAADVALRGLAIVLVVVNHASITDSRPVHLGGGLNILLLLSGFSFARFVLARGSAGAIRQGIAGFAWNLFWPALAVILLSFAAKREWSWGELFFVSTFWTQEHVALLYVWFPQVLLQLLGVLWLASFIPGSARAIARHPLAVAGGALCLAFSAWLLLHRQAGGDFANRTLPDVAWNFALGWLAWSVLAKSRGVTPRLALLALAFMLATVAFGWGVDWLRAFCLCAAMAALLFVPRIAAPSPVARILGVLSQAAYGIFLAHVLFLRIYDALHLRRTASGFDPIDTASAGLFALTCSLALWIAVTALRRAWRHEMAFAVRPVVSLSA